MKKYKIVNDCRGMDPDEIADKILQSRGIVDVEEFLNPTEENLLPPLKNTDKAVDRILDAVECGDKILVWADVDVD